MVLLFACSYDENKYDGAPLKIAVIGEVPEIDNEKIHFKTISLSDLKEKTLDISTNYYAVMITPTIFEKASEDNMAKVYSNLKLPIIFFNSKKRHLPFIREGITYETANWESLHNGSHTTIYLADVNKNSEDTWYFYLSDEKDINKLYHEIFKKVGEL